MAGMKLSKAHQNVIEIRLRSLERLLMKVKEALAGPPPEQWLTAYVEPLPEAIRDRLAALVIEAESALRQLIDDLNLRLTEVSISRMLLAHLILGSDNIAEVMTPYLKSSGPVPGELAAYLDPRLEKLNLLLAEATRLIESTLPAGEGRQPTSETEPRQEPDQMEASR
jgi:hypothetical protein